MIDYHCHLLPAIDDGAGTLAESLEMARILAAHGFRQVCCTPHCMRGSYDTTPAQVREAVAWLQDVLDREGIALRLQPGMEYHLDEHFLELDTLQTLGDSRLLLVEAPSQGNMAVINDGIFRIAHQGLTPLIAHPERCALLAPPGTDGLFDKVWTRFVPSNAKISAQNSLNMLKEMGCLFQGNLGSFSGVYGRRVEARARAMLSQGLYACLGSDGHRADALRSILAADAMMEAGVRELLERPGAIGERSDARGKNKCL
jgi:protein-tyrosine phosphatase